MSTPLKDLREGSALGPSTPMCLRIGIDLDNTLICYERVFLEAAQTLGLVGPNFTGGKRAVRDSVRQLPEGETLWQQIQGEVYGKRIAGADFYEGAEAFLRRCNKEGARVWVVSHKTQFNSYDADRVDLRAAALDWLEAKGLFGDPRLGVSRGSVFFEPTRTDKIARLASLGCTHIVDDLVEVFDEPSFPAGASKILFDPSAVTGQGSWASWPEIERSLFGPVRSAKAMGPGVGGRR